MEELKGIDFELFSPEIVSQIKLNKLKKLEINVGNCLFMEDVIQTCVDTFPTLTHFCLKTQSVCQNEVFKSLELISNLKNLKHFAFENNYIYGKNNNLFCDSLKRMANKCQKLKSIKCKFDITSDNSDLRHLLSPFEDFPALERLNLTFNCEDEFESSDISEMYLFHALKGLSNITHLTLRLDEDYSLRQKIEIFTTFIFHARFFCSKGYIKTFNFIL